MLRAFSSLKLKFGLRFLGEHGQLWRFYLFLCSVFSAVFLIVVKQCGLDPATSSCTQPFCRLTWADLSATVLNPRRRGFFAFAFIGMRGMKRYEGYEGYEGYERYEGYEGYTP